jgi:hypothetical protein
VEGIAASESDGDIVLSARFVKRDAACKFECMCTDSAPLTVVSLKEGSLTWERHDFAGNADVDGCPNNLGKRVFPDLINPTDGANAAQRRTVDLVATIKPPVKGATVYFKVWDVDDPFDQVNGIPNVSILDPDNPTTGPDNRGAEGVALPWTTSKATEANGKARVQFTVSMQPGDNYRAGASVLSDAPAQADQTDADAADDEFVGKPGDFAEYKVPLTWSPMLTVWRKLHVELDSMGPGTDPTTLTNRNLDDTGNESAHTGHTWAEINSWDAQEQNGRLEGGQLTVAGGGVYEIVDNVDDIGDDSVYVNGNILVDEDKPATATDDDVPFVPRKADISLMNAKYEPAYIEIQEHPVESQLNLPFVANLGNTDDVVVPATQPGRSATFLTSSDFWVVQIVVCYQGIKEQDHDPDDIYHMWTGTDFKRARIHSTEQGTLYAQTVPDNSGLYDNVSTVFLETIRDRAAWSVFFFQFPGETALLNLADVERITVVHEVGHVFGISANPHPSSGVMMNGAEDPSLLFQAEDLVTIRSSTVVGQP